MKQQTKGGALHRLWQALPWLWMAAAYLFDLWYQLVPGKWIVDSDLASEMILSDLLNKEGSIISHNWFYSTELKVVNLQWFYRLGLLLFPDDWHLARAFGMAVTLALYAACMLFFVKCARLGRPGLWMVGTLLWPFGQHYLVYAIYGGYYLVYTFFYMLVLALVLRSLDADKKHCALQWLAACIVTAIAGMNGVKQLMVFHAPLCIAAAILLVAMTILGASFQIKVNQFLTDTTVSGLQQNADTIAELAAAYFNNGGMYNRSFQLNLTVASQVSGADAVVCDSEGNVVLCSDAPSGCEHQGLQLNQAYLQKVIRSGGDTATGVSRPILVDGNAGGIVLVSTPANDITQIMNKISNIFLTAALFVVLISVLAVTAFARRESRPLKELAKTANAFGHGDLEARVRLDDDYSEEMEEVAVAFNNMAASLQKSEYRRQEFVANVSHELKTPMTTISGYVDGILDGTIPEDKREHYLHIVSDETKRLSRLVRSMLDISQLQKEGGIPEEKKMHFDLEECAGQVLITFEKKINDKHLNVNVDMPEHPVYTMANPDYITQVIYNLIDNAVKFCPDGGNLGLRIKEGGSKAYVSVSNDGETIPPDELPLVFDRFHKLDKSRSQNRDGWGLGLYIVKTIVCSHARIFPSAPRTGKPNLPSPCRW